MKNTICLLAALLIGIPAFSQKLAEEQVPPAVKQKFEEKYKQAKVRWEKNEEGNFEAEFKTDRKDVIAVFNTDGKWMETRTEINYKELPSEIITFIFEKYKGYDIEETEKIERPNGTTYHLQLDNNSEDKVADLTFDYKGSLIEEVVKDEK